LKKSPHQRLIGVISKYHEKPEETGISEVQFKGYLDYF